MPKTFQPADSHAGDSEVCTVTKDGVERECPCPLCPVRA